MKKFYTEQELIDFLDTRIERLKRYQVKASSDWYKDC